MNNITCKYYEIIRNLYNLYIYLSYNRQLVNIKPITKGFVPVTHIESVMYSIRF